MCMAQLNKADLKTDVFGGHSTENFAPNDILNEVLSEKFQLFSKTLKVKHWLKTEIFQIQNGML